MYCLAVLVNLLAYGVHGQLTAQTSVAPELRECYNDVFLQNRNNLPPSAINVLIDIIRKVEDHPTNVNMDLRQIAILLLHTYRQDGIEYHPQEENYFHIDIFPYAATFRSFHRHKLLLTRLIPNYMQVFDNTTLASPLKCAIHNMLSTTIDARQLVESSCPILTGVIRTSWGEVSAGNLIAGIAAGAVSQRVPVLDLARGASINFGNAQKTVSSVYAATLSGDLAEAVLIQGTERAIWNISIGAAGYWNSTQAPKYFMLHDRVNIEMTDPEIRGDIDGFVLGSTLITHLITFSTLKLSQFLDMYYSRNGVFNFNFRACNRRSLMQQYIAEANLIPETYNFAAALDMHMPLRGAITGRLVDDLVTNAISNFQSYALSMHDLNCGSTETLSTDVRLKTDLFLVIDAAWEYDVIYPAISYLLDTIDVNKFGSSVTLLSAFDGSIIINTTWSLADFHSEYTIIKHQSMLTGVNLQSAFTNIRTLMHERLENEVLHNYVGGNSSVLLFLLNTGNLQNNDQVWEQARTLNETVPDLKILFATSTNQIDNMWNLVRDMHEDIHTISLTATVNHVEVFAPILNRIQQAGRRIINPLCGARYPPDVNSGQRQFQDFVEPGYINFYSINPNYFYHNNDNRRIRITRTGAGVGSVVVCHSRVVTQPRQNASSTGLDENIITCQTIAATGNVEISLRNACDGYLTIDTCPFLYLSVQSITNAVSEFTATCTDAACRFPYNVQYTVQIEDFGCFRRSANMSMTEMTGKGAVDLTDEKRAPPPIEISNNSSVTNASPISKKLNDALAIYFSFVLLFSFKTLYTK